jgi:SAM-dependent methyltransferase
VLVDGFCAYAPDLAYSSGGFKASYFEGLARAEEAYFWFRARNELILWALEAYCPSFCSFLEIGCGTGYVLSGVSARYPSTALYASEILVDGLPFAFARVPRAEFMQMDARNIPFREEFDVIGAFDVLEHIDEDAQVLAQAWAALKLGGILLLTVPQHRWLWSYIDEYACHVRRYSAEELHRKLGLAGFEVLRSTSFVTVLLPPMLLSRLKKKRPDFNPTDGLKLPRLLNCFFYEIMRAEASLIKRGINLPVGGSRLVIARKIN